ncbi:restriction endonuclease subunit S [Erwinia sp. CGal63]|uniref:restriction endonuclease subunit S n=1 Tax=Erwinia sp. CGal63 TaxID=2919889 RepID=UPI003009BCA7
MAKYKAYPEYKESGAEWLGVIPEHWEVLRHKYIAYFTKGKNPAVLLDVPAENTLPYLSMDCLRSNSVDKHAIVSTDVRISVEGQPLIIWDGSNAGEFILGRKGILSSTMAAATLNYPLHIKYYWYLCITIEPEMRRHATGMGIPHVNGDELKIIQLTIPSFTEQNNIAAFLDHETAKIDKLIEKQQQLIELLKEKRQAVISHAVTKGLNPDVPMKDSGVEWLGDVPEHWQIIKIKYLVNTFEQGWSPQCEARLAEKNEYGVLKVGCVNSGKFNPLEHKALPLTLEPQKQYLLKKNDLLISRANTRELVGSTAVAESDYDNLIICDKLYRLKLKPIANPHFVCEFLRTPLVRQQIELAASGASHSMQNIGQDTIKEMSIALPPQNETESIIKYFNNQIDIFVRLSDLSRREIVILQERRTALISAAVTGKIDVRDWVAPDTQEVEEPQESTA